MIIIPLVLWPFFRKRYAHHRPNLFFYLRFTDWSVGVSGCVAITFLFFYHINRRLFDPNSFWLSYALKPLLIVYGIFLLLLCFKSFRRILRVYEISAKSRRKAIMESNLGLREPIPKYSIMDIILRMFRLSMPVMVGIALLCSWIESSDWSTTDRKCVHILYKARELEQSWLVLAAPVHEQTTVVVRHGSQLLDLKPGTNICIETATAGLGTRFLIGIAAPSENINESYH